MTPVPNFTLATAPGGRPALPADPLDRGDEGHRSAALRARIRAKELARSLDTGSNGPHRAPAPEVAANPAVSPRVFFFGGTLFTGPPPFPGGPSLQRVPQQHLIGEFYRKDSTVLLDYINCFQRMLQAKLPQCVEVTMDDFISYHLS